MTSCPGGVRRLAVLGSPIAHSKSPGAAPRPPTRVLGLDWTLRAPSRSTATGCASFLGALRCERGAGSRSRCRSSRSVLPLLDERRRARRAHRRGQHACCSPTARRVADSTPTSAASCARSREAGVLERVHDGVLIGGGATAASALVALAELGAERACASLLRRPEARGRLVAPRRVASGSSCDVSAARRARRRSTTPSSSSSTLPGGADLGVAASAALMRRATCCSTSPTTRGRARSPRSWLAARRHASCTGSRCCCTRRCVQVRIFVAGRPASRELPDEAAVLDVMRRDRALSAPVEG